tara:strand:- start:15 stop:695 length:681 start_codon:yes stop_codon:yes gene_type:complete
MKTIHEDEHLKISVIKHNNQGEACICFTGVGHALGGIDVQTEEFKNAYFFGTIIFVIDKKRSWGNSIDFGLLKCILLPYVSHKKVNLLGNSMGAFIGTIFSSLLNTDCCIGFVPQYSISEHILPEERRWKQYTLKIKELKYKTINDHFAGKTKYYFFSGSSETEKLHWSKFKQSQNIHHYIIAGQGHDLAKSLKERKVLYPLIEACYRSLGVEKILEEGGYDYHKL